ncbi:MAG: TetR/AcrR family transcriptional regulator [Acidimicrobiales bacterium]
MSRDATRTERERRYGGRTTHERRADRHARLLAAGLEVFGTSGFRTSTIEQLCGEAKVATRSFYEEFESREAVLIELHDDVNRRALTAVLATLESVDPADVEQRVRAGFGTYLDVMTTDPRWARIAFVEMVGSTPVAHAARRVALARFGELLEGEANRLAALGTIERRDYSLTATAVVGALTALVETWSGVDDRSKQVMRITDEATRLMMAALLGAPAS